MTRPAQRGGLTLPRILQVAEVAKALGSSRAYAYSLVQRRELPVVRALAKLLVAPTLALGLKAREREAG